MSKWTEEQKERVQAINAQVRQVKIEECGDAIQEIMEQQVLLGKLPLSKHKITENVPSQIRNSVRMTPQGAYFIPTVGNRNREVNIPKPTFVMNNWGEINIVMADKKHFYYKYYPARDIPNSKRGGWASCTMLEWQEFFGVRRAVISGSSDAYNECAEIVNKRGGTSPVLTVGELEAPKKVG